ncbi:kinase-like protein [Thelephora ganbajun]|uniref:Kinase-like protein n=1 Tax=Thelephora ganbajun TaxID=370292 RepID=A0ACB6Z1Q2_THEGA|nr:kinase-like protein [Thelephora ganbajun]
MVKDYGRLWKDVTNATDEGKVVRTLAEILSDKEGREFVSDLKHKDAELCIEILDHGIAEHKLKVAEKQAFFVTLRRLAETHGRLPDSITITENIEVEGGIHASGGFADVRSGRYMGCLVAVKTLRVAMHDDLLKIRKQFCNEVILWSTLSHPNVLKLVGVHGNMERGQFVTVSEWMTHGNIMEYIKNNHANRLELLHGVAQGLEYLHGANLAHGDLKGANILMSNDTPPRACLADFGFMTMVLDPNQPMSCSVQLEGGTMTFMSPELLMPSHFGVKDSVPTPQADVYAFGLVILQVLTGEIPFRRIPLTKLGYLVVGGLRPDKPENAAAIGFSDSLWGFVERCWRENRDLRPGVSEVVTHLEAAAMNWDGLMPPCAPADNIVSNLKEEMSGSMEHCCIFPQSTSSGSLASPTTESRTSCGRSSRLSMTSTQCAEPTREEVQGAVSKPSGELKRETWDTIRARPQEPQYDPYGEVFTHLDQHFEPPPSNLPQKKRKGIKHFLSKLRGFLTTVPNSLIAFRHGLMSSRVPANNTTSNLKKETLGLDQSYGISPRSPPSGLLVKSTTEPRTTSESLGRSDTQPAQSTGSDVTPTSQEGDSTLEKVTLSQNYPLSSDKIVSELVPSPNLTQSALVEITSESQRRPDQDFIDRIDEMLDHTVCDRNWHELLNILCKVCSRQLMIPKSMHMGNCLDGELVEKYDGGHANIYKGEHKGRAVAIKIWCLYQTSDLDNCFSEFCREAVAWRHLRHPNILPLLGVNLQQQRFAMISEWMDHGNINEFIKKHEGVNHVQLLVDAATGLEYMHSLHMVHGDLKGANILINQGLRACLADFGLSTIVGVERCAAANASLISVASKESLMSFTAGGTVRWMSPELLDPDRFGITGCRPTKQSDCYAFGMVVYEVLCGNAPYRDITNEFAVINTIMNGGRPQKPEAAENLGFTNELWRIVEQCWSVDISTRPDVRAVLSHLNHATWSVIGVAREFQAMYTVTNHSTVCHHLLLSNWVRSKGEPLGGGVEAMN